MTLNVDSLASPISLRPSVTLTDEELIRLSADNFKRNGNTVLHGPAPWGLGLDLHF